MSDENAWQDDEIYDDIHSHDYLDEDEDNEDDEMSPSEKAFMRGYEEAVGET